MNETLSFQKPHASRRLLCFWLLALLSFGWLAHHGWKSAHAFQGDDGQLYLGYRQFVTRGSYNLKQEPVDLVRPGEKLVPMQGPILNAYPPQTAVFYLPFALLPWSLSHNLWTLLNIACLLVCLVLLFDRFGRNLPRSLLPLWLAALFLSGPPYAVLFYGQILFPILLCLLLAWRLLEGPGRYGAWIAGLLYAVALVKPTISLPFLAYHLLRNGSRRAALIALGVTAAFTLAVMVYSGRPAGMLREYGSALTIMTQAHGVNDVGFGDDKRMFMSHIDVFFFDLIRFLDGNGPGVETPREVAVEHVLLLLFALSGLTLLVRHALLLNRAEGRQGQEAGGLRAEIDNQEATALAWLSVFTLMVFYHRWYDMGMLFVPLIVLLNALAASESRSALLLKTMLLNLFVVLFVLMRQNLVLKFSGATGWDVGVVYAVPRFLLVLLILELSSWVIRSQNSFLRSLRGIRQEPVLCLVADDPERNVPVRGKR